MGVKGVKNVFANRIMVITLEERHKAWTRSIGTSKGFLICGAMRIPTCTGAV